MSKNLYQQNKIITITEFILDNNVYASNSFQFSNKLDFFFFNGKIYEHGAENQIHDQIMKHFPHVKLSHKDICKIITRIQDLSTVTDNFDSPRYIAYLNCIHDKQLNKLLKFSPKFYITKLIPQNYIQQEESNSLTLLASRLALA